MRQSSHVVKITPALQPVYAGANLCVGGKLTISAAALNKGAGVTLLSVVVREKGTHKAPLSILIFDADPNVGTYADNASPTIDPADVLNCVGKIDIATADYTSVGGVSVARPTIPPLVCNPTAAMDLFAIVVTTGAITWDAVNALSLQFGFLQD